MTCGMLLVVGLTVQQDVAEKPGDERESLSSGVDKVTVWLDVF